VNVEVDVEISIDLPFPDIHYGNRRESRTRQCVDYSEMGNMELYENIIDLLDFEDVFEYFDDPENLVEQMVLENVGFSINILRRSLVAESSVEQV